MATRARTRCTARVARCVAAHRRRDVPFLPPNLPSERCLIFRQRRPSCCRMPRSSKRPVAAPRKASGQLAQLIELGADPRRVEPPPSTLAFIRSAVWRQVPLADNMRFYRLAQEQVWQWFFARITATCHDPVDLATALELTTRFLFAFVDGATVRVDEAYEVERETWLRGAAAARADAIEDILADREHDGQAASKRLRYDVGRHHLGVIAWLEQVPKTGDALSLLNESIALWPGRSPPKAASPNPLGLWWLRHGSAATAPFRRMAWRSSKMARGQVLCPTSSVSRWVSRDMASRVSAAPTFRPATREGWHRWSEPTADQSLGIKTSP